MRTKLIVIAGYGIMVALSIFGIVWIYQEWLKYSELAEPHPERQELVILSNTLATMYHAEGTMGLLTLVTDPELSLEYDSLMTTVFDQIGYLKNVSEEPYLNDLLDSLDIFLLKKQENTAELVQLMKSFQNNTIKEITQRTILDKKDLDMLDNLLVNTMQQFEDTTKVVGEKKGFFKRIGDAIKSNNPDTLQSVTSRSAASKQEIILPSVKDTIVEFIQEINLVTRKKNAAIAYQLILKQNELYSMNEKTTSQINRIMNEIETKNYQSNLKLADERAETIKRSSVIISIIAMAAILVALIFMSWIIHSITVSQRLQREVEAGKKHVEKLLVSREQLLLTITHDIKAPISSILGYLELMMKDKPSSRDGYYIENMQHSATHILDLIRNLLDFHSLDINGQKVEKLPFSPAILLTDIYESFIPEARKKELKFELRMTIGKEENYTGDPYRIRQIVNNLLSNAIKFTPAKGSIILSAGLTKNKRKTELSITVQDTGPGIKEQDKKSIFDEFSRLDYTGKGIEGSGLGLSISHKLAQLLDGSISVDSTLGKGSLFTVALPIAGIVADPAKQSINKYVDTSRLNILFIDDDIVQLNLLTELLKREGMIPHTCSGSLEALRRLQEEHFDIVFSDIQMPDMNGFELVERIRLSDFEGAKTVPVIGLSANSHLSEAKYKEAGFSAFLAKPFTIEQLLDAIYKYTGKENAKKIAVQKKKGFDALIEFAGDDANAKESIMHSFIIENKKNYTALEQAFETKDWVTVRNVSHKMTPLMKMVSAKKLVVLLQEYENGSQSEENKVLLLGLIQEKIEEAEKWN
ncbi:MAG: response regulator [Candidatus Symbiothrix sp.]|jgi:signal transduction histidine kinase/CheY-like chemotaxis protein|nr:response regulator [Candidatus Symbiothrix sp.]